MFSLDKTMAQLPAKAAGVRKLQLREVEFPKREFSFYPVAPVAQQVEQLKESPMQTEVKIEAKPPAALLSFMPGASQPLTLEDVKEGAPNPNDTLMIVRNQGITARQQMVAPRQKHSAGLSYQTTATPRTERSSGSELYNQTPPMTPDMEARDLEEITFRRLVNPDRIPKFVRTSEPSAGYDPLVTHQQRRRPKNTYPCCCFL